MSENKEWNWLQKCSVFFASMAFLVFIAIVTQKVFHISDYACGFLVGWFICRIYIEIEKR